MRVHHAHPSLLCFTSLPAASACFTPLFFARLARLYNSAGGRVQCGQ
ncbi:predicted protein [Plenodomus lingam JN3]|uniref:Predicted protein n=1 Tax=Leptosphaeria maculans (strain JN3 / isolate v23.1.3 / race Av1-4-5-6-7-8) TaxID=985895 RepID=E5A465_LEPMJ|nr:predicted protein [Plenodomus lingam JN3]CBX98410.1 predicted protein [Plenodomus lingam JN3]